MVQLTNLLPGLYLLAVTAAVVWALGRWYDPVPGRPLAVFLLAVGFLFGGALFGGRTLVPVDLLRLSAPFEDLAPSDPPAYTLQADELTDFAPYFSQVRRALRRGEWPLLSDLVGAGEPLLANSQAQHFHPLMLLTDLFPLRMAVGLVAAFKVLLALVLTFLLLRRLGLGEEPATAGALAYGLGGFMLFYLGWPQTQSAAALPLELYALELAIGRGWPRDWILASVATATVLLSGHPETMVYVVLLAGAFALVRLVALPRERRGGTLARLAAVTLAAAFFAAPVLLPTALIGGSSERYAQLVDRSTYLERHSAEAADAETADALSNLGKRTLPVVAPLAFGSNRQGPYWGASGIFRDAAGFAGTAAAFAALLALWPLGARRRFPAERLMLVAGALSFLVFAQPPGMRRLLGAIPVLRDSASYNRRLAMVLCFAIAFLAAATLERWRQWGLGRRRVLTSAALLGVVVVWAYIAHPQPSRPEAEWALRHRALAVQLLTLAAACLLLMRPRRDAAWVPWTFALVGGLELAVLLGGFNPSMPARLYFPQRPGIHFLQTHLGDERMVALDNVFLFNVPAIYGVADIRSGNPLQPANLARFTRPARSGAFDRRFVAPEHPLYDLLGVRYVVVQPGRRLPPPLRRVFRGRIWIYERPHPLPRLFLPQTAVVRTGRRWIGTVRAIDDFSRRAAVASPPPATPAASRWEAAGPRPGVGHLEIRPTHVSADVALAEPRLLASGMYQDGGWRLLVDGRATPTVITNGLFVGAWLPAGRHRLDLVYRPPGFVPGCLLAALGLAGAILLGLWPAVDGGAGRAIPAAARTSVPAP